MTSEIRVISSMATRRLLADLMAAFKGASPQTLVSVESVGGVEASKRVEAGERFDAVVLASGAIDTLIAHGRIVAGSRVDLVTSPVAIAVPAGAPHMAVESEDDVKRAVMSARTIGYSTGPSGDHLARTFARWGVADAIRERIVQAPPGVPVGTLVAKGEVELGFQQLSELMHHAGIDVLGLLPPEIQSITTFSAGVSVTSTQPDAVRALLAFLSSPDVAEIKRQHGMDPSQQT
jgi:molybdate transport system substrate-binding protein